MGRPAKSTGVQHMNKLTILTTSMTGLLVAGLSMSAFADSANKAAEIEAQKNATITTEMAITIAEQLTGGKSTEAEFELEDGKAIYEVELTMDDGSEVEVEVDAETGVVLSQKTEDDDDDDDKNDRQDEDKA